MLRFDESGEFAEYARRGSSPAENARWNVRVSVEITVPHRENLDSGDLDLALRS
jgi:hypothetical protein